MTYKLINKETGHEIKKGDTVFTFRGEQAIVTGFQEPRHPASTGRVYVTINEINCGFYPSVIHAEIVEQEMSI